MATTTVMATTTARWAPRTPTAARARASSSRRTSPTGKGARVTSTRATTTRERLRRVRARANEGDAEGDVPFGYTRADVMLIGGGVTGAGFAAYYGLQSALGWEATRAGNAVQLTFVFGLTVAWVGSYVLRVFNKDMTYVKQLKDYEEAVMQKRLEEMPAQELEKMMSDLEEK